MIAAMRASGRILLMDIGNSSFLVGRLQDGILSRVYQGPTSDIVSWLLAQDQSVYDEVIVSSVVPKVDDQIRGIHKLRLLRSQDIPRLTLQIDNPDEVGMDRLVAALGAYDHYQQHCLILDSGTATTFCYVDSDGGYQGGVILPGLKISSKALNQYTGKIPLINVSVQTELVGKNTRDCVQIGLYRGTIKLINGLISDFRSTYPGLKVIGTGGGLDVLRSELDLDDYDEDLILKGLALCS